MRSIVCLMAVLCAQLATAATVVVTSTPSGATVTIGDVTGKTPCRLRVAQGPAVVVVEKSGYESSTKDLTVRNLIVHNVELVPLKYPVDIMLADPAQTGWALYDGRRLLVSDGMITTAPTTLHLPVGKYRFCLMKPGFKDIQMRQYITVTAPKDDKPAPPVIINDTPKSGLSSYYRCIDALIVGEWHHESGRKIQLNADKTYTMHRGPGNKQSGKWEFDPATGRLTASGMSVFTFSDANTLRMGDNVFVRHQ